MTSWERWYQTAIAAGIAPEVLGMGLASMFVMRWWFRQEKGKSIIVVSIFCLLGQVHHSESIAKDWDDILFFTALESFIATGLYSVFEYIKAMDLIKNIATSFANKVCKG